MFAKSLCAVAFTAGLAAHSSAQGPAAPAISAADLMRAAVADRLGPGVEVTVTPITVPAAGLTFRSATPDPSAWLGRPVRFTLVTGSGPAVSVTADVRVVADYAVAARAIGRDRVLAAEDLTVVHRDVRDVPIRRLPDPRALVGARALRPIDAGATIQAPFVIVRRTIEPGDTVTAVASAGTVEITATLVAADGGGLGDVIRMVNPDTRRYLRGRIVRAGYVEVIR